MQARPFEKAVSLTRFDPHLRSLTIAIDRDRHLAARLALSPDSAEQPGEIADLFSSHREYNIANPQVGALGRPAIGKPDHHQAVLHFGRVKAEPRPRRRIAPSELHEVVENRLQKIH